MNIKYQELSVIGKVWSIAELLYVGLRDNNKKYVEVAFSKLQSLNAEDIQSKAIFQHSITNLMDHANTYKHLI